MKPAVYLAGAMAGVSDKETFSWRRLATELLAPELDVLDPSRRDYRGRDVPRSKALEVVAGDLAEIDQAAAVLVRYRFPSVGTSMEMFYAYRYRKIPVVLWLDRPQPAVLSPWLKAHYSYVTLTLRGAVGLLKETIQGD